MREVNSRPGIFRHPLLFVEIKSEAKDPGGLFDQFIDPVLLRVHVKGFLLIEIL